MDQKASVLVLTIGVLLLGATRVAECRQMCWSCQFVSGGGGEECITAPGNWTGGEPRVKCPTECITMAEFAVTGEPTYFYRGCGTDSQKDGCYENGARHSCFFSCGDGKNYCNDRSIPTSPLLDEGDGSGRTGAPSPLLSVGLALAIWSLIPLLLLPRRQI